MDVWIYDTTRGQQPQQNLRAILLNQKDYGANQVRYKIIKAFMDLDLFFQQCPSHMEKTTIDYYD